MGPLVGGDEAEVICVGKGDELLVLKTISEAFIKLEGLEDGVEDEEEDDWRYWIALKDSSFKAEGVTLVIFCNNYGIGLFVEA